ncbi:MAG: hypothetical protein ACO4AV_13380 [bacterium]
MKATIQFNSGSELFPVVSDSKRIELIRDELQEIFNREVRKHIMDSTPGLDDMLCEAITIISNFIDYEPSDEEMMGEPPLSADELHSAAWAQHQELHR